jgi:hypothetical protein
LLAASGTGVELVGASIRFGEQSGPGIDEEPGPGIDEEPGTGIDEEPGPGIDEELWPMTTLALS